MQKPAHQITFDILLTYFGRDDLFKKSVESILAQTYPHFRLLIVDDAYPTNDMQNWIKSLNDERIVYSKNKENLGIIRNFAHAISLSENEWVTLPGSDDIFLPNHLETAAQIISQYDQNEVAVYSSNFSIIDANGKIIHTLVDKVKHVCYEVFGTRGKQVALRSGDALTASLSRSYWVQWPCLFFKLSKLKNLKVDESYLNNADQILLNELLLKNQQSAIINSKRTFLFRRHAGSGNAVVTKSGVRWNEDEKMYSQIAAWAKEVGFKRTQKAAKNHFLAKINKLTSGFFAR